VVETLLSVTALALLLVIVIVEAALVVPAGCDGKLNLVGANVSGANEVPVMFTTSGLLLLLVVNGTAIVPPMTPTKAG